MLEEAGLLPPRSLARYAGICARRLRSCRLAPAFVKPVGPPRAMLDRVTQQCLGGGEGGSGGGLVLVTSSFGIEPPRPLPPSIKMMGRGHKLETVDALAEHPELKVKCWWDWTAGVGCNADLPGIDVLYIYFEGLIFPSDFGILSLGGEKWKLIFFLASKPRVAINSNNLGQNFAFTRVLREDGGWLISVPGDEVT